MAGLIAAEDLQIKRTLTAKVNLVIKTILFFIKVIPAHFP